MPRLRYLITRRMGAFGIALTAFDVWRRIPPNHRRRILAEARKHGPRLAKAAAARRAAARRRRRPRR
ncbi:MAG TPA: hypothetical protein VFL41_02045 [Gaiellaceae bacterium]|nr:hypothetical protein [Gaiellaceae bacterium]